MSHRAHGIRTLSSWRVAHTLMLLGTAAAIAVACSSPYPPPPETRRDNVLDTLHGVEVVDPYRWLEEQDDPEVRAWIDAQNAYAEAIVGESPLRARLRERFRELYDLPDKGSPRGAGDYELFTLRRTGMEQAVIYRRAASDDDDDSDDRIDPDAEYEVVIDPLEMDPGHTTSVSIQTISRDGKYMIYSVRDGGQDEVAIRVLDLETGDHLPDSMPEALYGDFAFESDASGFYYGRRSRRTGGRIYFHRLGTSFDDDEELFGAGYGPDKFVGMSRADGGRYRLFDVWHGWTRVEIHFQDTEAGGPLKPIVDDEDARFFSRFVDGELYLQTNLDAPNFRLLAVDLEKPEKENWREVIPEGEDVMQGYSLIDDRFYVTYLHDISTQIKIFEKDGTPAGAIEVPEYHSAGIWGAEEGKAFLNLSSYTSPPVTYKIDLETREREVWEDREVPFDPAGIEVEQVWYESKDGTDVPMYLIHREGLELTGDHPTMLYGYGGFTSAMTPRFDPTAAVWVEQGGVYAVANLRGGTEFGERWHREGMLENKQNVFDDFIAAAEWLIDTRYTNPERLAIRGGSNGGLLVGAAITQRPDLFRAALCLFPDLDMVRFYTFTETNNLPALHEYGDASIPEHFEFLQLYSPYQNVKNRTRYPAVMLTTGDLDTRVPPLQARKMTARLQAATRSGLPVVLRYDLKGGHTANRGRPFSRGIDHRAMEIAFVLKMLGVGDM